VENSTKTVPQIKGPRRRVSHAARLTPGVASEFIDHADDLPAGTLVVLCVRKSRGDRKETLERQEQNLAAEADARGLVRVGVVRHIGPGWDPAWLAEATAEARQLGAALLAESPCRLIRSKRYHSVNHPNEQADIGDLKNLRKVTQGDRLATIVHPDATPGEERSYQTRRGNPGRPVEPGYKKRRRQRLLKQVLELRAEGNTYRTISETTGLPIMTIFDWVHRDQTFTDF
jgi:hypothetical protein